jgi:hypothetical protein
VVISRRTHKGPTGQMTCNQSHMASTHVAKPHMFQYKWQTLRQPQGKNPHTYVFATPQRYTDSAATPITALTAWVASDLQHHDQHSQRHLHPRPDPHAPHPTPCIFKMSHCKPGAKLHTQCHHMHLHMDLPGLCILHLNSTFGFHHTPAGAILPSSAQCLHAPQCKPQAFCHQRCQHCWRSFSHRVC